MDDLQPLVDDPESSPLGRALLASARADVPSPGARARAARRLGIAAILTVGAGAGSEAGAVAVAGKLVVVLLALGGVVGLAMWQSTAAPPGPVEPRVASQPAAPARDPAIARTPAAPATAPAPAAVEAAPPAPAPAVVPPVTTAPARPRSVRPHPAPPQPAPGPAVPAAVEADPAVASSPPPPPIEPALPPQPPTPQIAAPPDTELPAGPSRLAAEVALLDRARSGLAAGDDSAALAALAEYHQRFANGDLDAEADMVMIEILIAQREIQRARTLGAAFFARFPRSPLVQRVHSLLDGLPK